MELILILSGGWTNGELDEITRRSCQIALDYYKKSSSSEIVVTGGHLFGGQRFSSAMRSYLMELGIRADSIWEERWPSLDTIQNIKATIPIVKELRPSKIVLIALYGRHLLRASDILLRLLLKEGVSLPSIELVASAPDYPWGVEEKIAQLFHQIDPLGKTPLYKLARWARYNLGKGIRV